MEVTLILKNLLHKPVSSSLPVPACVDAHNAFIIDNGLIYVPIPSVLLLLLFGRE